MYKFLETYLLWALSYSLREVSLLKQMEIKSVQNA